MVNLIHIYHGVFYAPEKKEKRMAFSQTDLDNIETAIAAMGTGTSVVEVFVAGKKVVYRPSDLPTMLTVRTMIQRELGEIPTTVYTKNMGRTRT